MEFVVAIRRRRIMWIRWRISRREVWSTLLGRRLKSSRIRILSWKGLQEQVECQNGNISLLIPKWFYKGWRVLFIRVLFDHERGKGKENLNSNSLDMWCMKWIKCHLPTHAFHIWACAQNMTRMSLINPRTSLRFL